MANRCFHIHGAQSKTHVTADGNDQPVRLSDFSADGVWDADAHTAVVSGGKARSRQVRGQDALPGGHGNVAVKNTNRIAR